MMKMKWHFVFIICFLLGVLIIVSCSLFRSHKAGEQQESETEASQSEIYVDSIPKDSRTKQESIATYDTSIDLWQNCFLILGEWASIDRSIDEDGGLRIRFGNEAEAVFRKDTNALVSFENWNERGYTDIDDMSRSLIEEILLEVGKTVAANLKMGEGEYEVALTARTEHALETEEKRAILSCEIRAFPDKYYFPAGTVYIEVDVSSRRATCISTQTSLTPEVPIVNFTEQEVISSISVFSGEDEGTLKTPSSLGFSYFKNPMYLRTVGVRDDVGVKHWDCNCVRVRLCYSFYTAWPVEEVTRIAVDAETGDLLEVVQHD